LKKSAILAFVVAITMALCMTLIPNVFSQPENVRVLSYSWYFGGDYLGVVGEIQNVGPNIIDFVRVVGTFYASDGTPLGGNSVKSLATEILPQQKAPFYMVVLTTDSLTGFSWDPTSIDYLTILVNQAEPTASSQYQGLEISSHESSTDAYGYYKVTGVVKNTGTQSINQASVVATFYNSTGSVVAVGTSYLTPSSIAPGSTASFTVYPLDYLAVMGEVSSYSLLIQTPPITTPSATPTPSPTASPSLSPTPTEAGNGNGIPDTYVYGTAAVVIVCVAIGIFALSVRALRRKRVGGRPRAHSQKRNKTKET
jgi:hypothetical protein